jgi:hypothetical protein
VGQLLTHYKQIGGIEMEEHNVTKMEEHNVTEMTDERLEEIIKDYPEREKIAARLLKEENDLRSKVLTAAQIFNVPPSVVAAAIQDIDKHMSIRFAEAGFDFNEALDKILSRIGEKVAKSEDNLRSFTFGVEVKDD